MSLSATFDSISNTITTGTIIAIVVGSVFGLAVLIGIIIAIVCIAKYFNRRKNIATQGMILQSSQPYAYPHSWSDQYLPNTVSVANYPPMHQPATAPYIVSAPNYVLPANI